MKTCSILSDSTGATRSLVGWLATTVQNVLLSWRDVASCCAAANGESFEDFGTDRSSSTAVSCSALSAT